MLRKFRLSPQHDYYARITKEIIKNIAPMTAEIARLSLSVAPIQINAVRIDIPNAPNIIKVYGVGCSNDSSRDPSLHPLNRGIDKQKTLTTQFITAFSLFMLMFI